MINKIKMAIAIVAFVCFVVSIICGTLRHDAYDIGLAIINMITCIWMLEGT